MKPRLRWRREPNEKGLARVCQGWRGYELRRGTEVVARVALAGVISGEPRYYWHGNGRNTLAGGNVFDSPSEAKTDAMAAALDAEAKG